MHPNSLEYKCTQMLFYMWGATKGFCCNNVVKPDLSWWMLAYWLLLANDFNILVLCDCLLFLVFRWQGQKLSRIKGVVAESELQVVDLCCAGDWAAKAHDRSWLPDNAGYNRIQSWQPHDSVEARPKSSGNVMSSDEANFRVFGSS